MFYQFTFYFNVAISRHFGDIMIPVLNIKSGMYHLDKCLLMQCQAPDIELLLASAVMTSRCVILQK